jgi:hypothetical protein
MCGMKSVATRLPLRASRISIASLVNAIINGNMYTTADGVEFQKSVDGSFPSSPVRSKMRVILL